MTTAVKQNIRKIRALYDGAATPGDGKIWRVTKRSMVTRMMVRKNGATLAEIMAATNWQEHAVRSFVSASIGKVAGNRVVSDRNAKGERRFRLHREK